MRRPISPTPLEINLAPMVDVMMCLLIFFMLATKMVEREHSRIDLPAARSAPRSISGARSERFVVNVLAAPRPSAGATTYIVQEQTLTPQQVAEQLGLRRAVDPELRCIIRADRTVPYRDVEAILIACAEADMRDVAFSTIEHDEDRP